MNNENNNYYNKINCIRAISCIAILLYHMNILHGGYLAVCTFLVLSGYLTVTSFFNEKKTIKEYYFKRLKKIYIPLLIVVFMTIAVISFIPSINWYNLKPETISILLGYNNFWQIKANVNYFIRNINSPFTHLWYMGIMLEFYIIFPIIFLILKKIGEKTKKYIPCVILIIISIISYFYFYKMFLSNNIMIAYYSSFTRLFSLSLGMLAGFISHYYNQLISNTIIKNVVSVMCE